MAHGIEQPITTKEADVPTASSQEKMLLQSHCKPLCPPPRFAEITCAMQGEGSGHSHLLSAVTGILAEEAKDQYQYEVMGSLIMLACLFRHPTLGDMYIDLFICMISIVDLGPSPTVGDHLSLTLPEMADLD